MSNFTKCSTLLSGIFLSTFLQSVNGSKDPMKSHKTLHETLKVSTTTTKK